MKLIYTSQTHQCLTHEKIIKNKPAKLICSWHNRRQLCLHQELGLNLVMYQNQDFCCWVEQKLARNKKICPELELFLCFVCSCNRYPLEFWLLRIKFGGQGIL